jgi:hypothetical protein
MSADWGDNNIAGVVVISLMEFEKKMHAYLRGRGDGDVHRTHLSCVRSIGSVRARN